MAKIPCFQCRGPGSDPRSGNPVAQMVEDLPGNAGDTGWIPRWGRSLGGGNGYLLQYSCLENPHGQRSLGGYSSWDRKESDMTEQLTLSQTLQLIRGQKIEDIKEQHQGSREKEVGRGI